MTCCMVTAKKSVYIKSEFLRLTGREPWPSVQSPDKASIAFRLNTWTRPGFTGNLVFFEKYREAFRHEKSRIS